MRKPDLRSPEARRYRRLYNTARWQRIRSAQLRAHPLCQRCEARGFVIAATVCNHVDPKTKESEATFFDGPFNSLCAPCHDGPVQSEERTGQAVDRIGASSEVRADGFPADARHRFYRSRA